MGVIPLFPDKDWFLTLLMLYGAAWISFFVFAPKYLPHLSTPPSWFTSALFTVEFGVAVFVVCIVIITSNETQNLLVAFAMVAATIWYSLKQKDIWLYSMLFIGALCVLECVYFRCLLPTFGLFYQIMLSVAALGGASFAIVRQNEKWKQEKSGTSTNQSEIDNGK